MHFQYDEHNEFRFRSTFEVFNSELFTFYRMPIISNDMFLEVAKSDFSDFQRRADSSGMASKSEPPFIQFATSTIF
jgi:hypothetical protein